MHLIQQHILDINCPSKTIGMEVQKDVSALMEKEFYPRLELLLDKYDNDKAVWKIDRLSLDLPSIAYKGWKSDFITQSLAQIENYLLSNFQKESAQSTFEKENVNESYIVSIQQDTQNVFIGYLKTGIITANASFKDLSELLQVLEINEGFVVQLTILFSNNYSSLVRYLFSIPKEIRNKIEQKIDLFHPSVNKPIRIAIDKVKAISGKPSEQLADLFLWLYYFSEKGIISKNYATNIFQELSMEHWGITQVIYTELVAALHKLVHTGKTKTKNPAISNSMMEFIETLHSHAQVINTKKEASRPPEYELQQDNQSGKSVDKTNQNTEPADKSQNDMLVYIENAGLVILHPFLKTLFERLELWADQDWTTRNNQHKAILLTQYLVTGSTSIGENELVLNKILCGFPVAGVVNTKIEISEHDKEQCNELLLAVIANWDILKNTSVAGLRETFLMRAGKLEIKEHDAAQLWVEQKGVDVLLSHLPWGISMIKTPWMTDFLHCHWR